MTKLESIEKAVTELSDEERKKLRAFLDELEADAWDAQIERDSRSGKLDKLAAQALAEYQAGRTEEF